MYTLASLVFLTTLIAFVVFWWKKRKARIAAGADYMDDQNYQKVSKIKRLIGVVCVVSFVIGLATQPERTPEEKAKLAQQQQTRELKNKEDEVRSVFDKQMRKYKDEMRKAAPALTDWKFVGVNSIEFVDDDKAIVRWEEEFNLLINKKKVKQHKPGTTYFRKFNDKWELVLDDWQKP